MIVCNYWHELPTDVWAKILGENLTYSEIKQLHFNALKWNHPLCRKWNHAIVNKTAGQWLMALEDLKFVPGEPWYRTFENRCIIIALDCSASITTGTENWRYDVAVSEVKAITTQYFNFAGAKGIIFMPFANSTATVVIKHPNEIDGQLSAIRERGEGGIGGGNNWELTCNDILHQINESPHKANVYLLSDLDLAGGDRNHPLWSTAYKIPPQMYVCRIGNATSGKGFADFIVGADSPDVDAPEPVNKKRKTDGNLGIFYKHISSNDGNRLEFTLSRAPTEVIEPNDPMFDEVEEEEEDSLVPTDVDGDDQDYDPHEDYMNGYQSDDEF